MTPKPPSERDTQADQDASICYRWVTKEIILTNDPVTNEATKAYLAASLAQLLAQAREEGRLEGIEQAAPLFVAAQSVVALAEETDDIVLERRIDDLEVELLEFDRIRAMAKDKVKS